MIAKQTVVHVARYDQDASKALEVAAAEVPTAGEGEVLVRLTMRPVHPADIFSAQGESDIA